MAHVSVTKSVNAPATKVWAMVSEWGGTHKWIPGVGPVTVEGTGVGSVRSADLDPATGFAGRISERLESFDEGNKIFSYRVIGESPIPISNYVATMQVVPHGDRLTEVTWSCNWEVNGDMTEAELVSAFEGLYEISLNNVCSALE
ncbi:MAG: carbon monoxide dehydrogenase subunit G [Gammaproteobacteria bacterium]|jgi:carbon monoxide dehydrogenase subunit G